MKVSLVKNISDDQIIRDWSLTKEDRSFLLKISKKYRSYVAVQLCCLKIYGRFSNQLSDLSHEVIFYINDQLDLPTALHVTKPERKATYLEYRKIIFGHLNFSKFDNSSKDLLQHWIAEKDCLSLHAEDLCEEAKYYLISKRIILPSKDQLQRFINSICSNYHQSIFEKVNSQIEEDLQSEINKILNIGEDEQLTWFQRFKEYPPAASITSIKNYLEKYERLIIIPFDSVDITFLGTSFSRDLFKQAKYYSADAIKRFKIEKRNTIILVFLNETRKILLDYLAQMHERYIADICRQCANIYNAELKQYQNKHNKALDRIVTVVDYLLEQELQDSTKLDLNSLFQSTHSKIELSESRENMRKYQVFLKYGYSNLLQNRHQSMRRYFADYVKLINFKAPKEDSSLVEAIEIVKQLDNKELKSLPNDVPYDFINKDLRKALFDQNKNIKRNVWEMGVAIAIKESLVSGDIYIPQSKKYISFKNLVYSDKEWEKKKDLSYKNLELESESSKAIFTLKDRFITAVNIARDGFKKDDFADIKDNKLKPRKKDALEELPEVERLQKILSSSLPKIKIEQLLIEVDQMTGFSRHFTPIHKQKSHPADFYKTLMAGLLSQATNIGMSAMQDCTINITSDMIRYVMETHIREDNIKLANTDLVNQHSMLPFSNIHGDGSISSSDGQRFAVTASSLMSSFCPRYFGYYEKAVGIYTHVSDQYSVYNTKVISCSPREALYVLDGLLENNTILENKEHTTDTEGFTEHIFALSFLLGYQFVPRIKNLKDQQLYCINKELDYGEFNSILNKSIDMDVVEEQWDEMIRTIASLKDRLAPAHEIVRRLSKGNDRLAKAFTNLGRLLKTQHIG